MAPEPVQLKRRLNFWQLMLFGLGTILGAGIYALVGKVAGLSGYFTPWAFLLSALLVLFSALSYAELSVRFPKSAGEAYYVHEAFNLKIFSIVVGSFLLCSGMFSTATLLQGFVGYLHEFISASDTIIILITLLSIGIIVSWGIRESVSLAAIITVVEVIGLGLIIWTGKNHLAEFPSRFIEFVPPLSITPWTGITLGAFVAFFSFIGFEDIVNVAEEVKNPRRSMPLAILSSLIIATLLYIVVSLVAILSVEPHLLSQSKAPLALVFQTNTGKSSSLLSVIALFAVINGALVQIIMASRVLYGMATQSWMPPIFARVHKKTHTPLIATWTIIAIILVFALWLPILSLAKLTSLFTILVFIAINLALIWIKRQARPKPSLAVPLWIPIVGATVSIAFLLLQILS
jgi:basic amino acid/polyamine antiporter, APA family